MRKERLIFAILLTLWVKVSLQSFWVPPTVSNINFDAIGDSTVRIYFDVSATFTNLRVRFGTSDCAGGAGTVQDSDLYVPEAVLIEMTRTLGGLAPSTLYYVCPEVSNDSGSTYSSGVSSSFMTLARGTTTPTAPEAVPTTYPAQTGSTLTVSANCSDFGTHLTNAVPGDTIQLPANISTCTSTYTTPLASAAMSFTSSDITTSTSSITISGGHGFVENQEIQFSHVGLGSACLPGNNIFPDGWRASGTCDKSGGIVKTEKYYAHVLSSTAFSPKTSSGGSVALFGYITFTCNAGTDYITYRPTRNTPGGYSTVIGAHTVPANQPIFVYGTGNRCGLATDTQYYLLDACTSSANVTCTTRLSTASGGSVFDLSAGTGINTILDKGTGTMYVMAAPQSTDPWILVKGGSCPALGTKVDSSYSAQLAHIVQTTRASTPQIELGILAHNWRFECLSFETDGMDTDSASTIDPRPYCIGWKSNIDNRYIAFTHIRVVGPPTPSQLGCRQGGGNIFWDGAYTAVRDSDFTNLQLHHPRFGTPISTTAGFTTTRASGTQLTTDAGVAYLGAVSTTITGTPAITTNLTGGTATGTVTGYVAIDGTVKVLAPTGTTGNCSIAGTIAPSGSLTCTFTAVADTSVPTTSIGGNNLLTGLQFFSATITSGSFDVSGVTVSSRVGPTFMGSFANEGSNSIIAGNGPGPYLFHNNSVSGTGLTIHFDESAGTMHGKHDCTITQNTFTIPTTSITTQSGQDGLWYGNRQPLEFKDCVRVLIQGNIFKNCYAQINNIGTCIIITPRTGGTTTDLDIRDNTFVNVSGMTTSSLSPERYPPVSKPSVRQRITNNVAYITAYSRYVIGDAQPAGYVIYGGDAAENIDISNNTAYDARGNGAQFLHWTWQRAGGVSVHDNVWFYNGQSYALVGEATPAACTVDKTFMDNCFTDGVGVGSYTFNKNVIISGWSDTSVPSGIKDYNVINTAFSGLTNFVPTQATVALEIAAMKFTCGSSCSDETSNLELAPDSPYYHLGTGGASPGVNWTNLLIAQGTAQAGSAISAARRGAVVLRGGVR